MLNKTKHGWWKSAVFYQIYPKSFQDTDGDGVGDLRGVISRLDYLAELGIDGIWLSPVCASPQADHGYDISDYCAIDPMFGTMEDMEELIREAKARGISIIMDLVLNHSSDEHPWFVEAKKSRDNPYHDFYVWRDGDGVTPPNDMRACFGGSSWTYVPEIGQYYFHQFAVKQPDLNWENPKLRRALYDCIRFWVEKGVEGFRLDVIDQIAKEPDNGITANGPRLHEFLRELSAEAFCEEGLVTVGEAWGSNVERARLYSAPDASEMSMVFQFEHIGLDNQPGKDKWDVRPLPLPALKRCYERWQHGLHGTGWNSLFMDNHDLPRIVSRWGDDKRYRVESAKMLATMLHGMQGTPYVYQGEELGMTNIRLPIEQYVDIEIRNIYEERIAQGYAPEDVMASIWARGRDNARTPMQWSAGENAGFSEAKPWLPVNPNYTFINAEQAMADPDSVFHYYKQLIALRKAYPVFRDGTFTLLDPENEKVFAYTRDTEDEHLLVVCNFTGESVPFEIPQAYRGAKVLITNYPDAAPVLRPYECGMLWYADDRPLDKQTCVFDLYGTLVDIHTDEEREALWQAMAEYYEARGAAYTAQELKAAYEAHVAQAEAGMAASDVHEAHPEIQIETVFAALYADKGVPVTCETAVETGLHFRKLSTDYIHLYDGAKELLLALREAGKKVYLLSNAQAIFTRWELETLGLADCFDGMLLSSDYGVKKPDERFYGALLDAYGLDPADAVMIGNDARCDILGAQAAGMETVYIRSNISPREPLPQASRVLGHMDLARVRRILLGA